MVNVQDGESVDCTFEIRWYSEVGDSQVRVVHGVTVSFDLRSFVSSFLVHF
jgi:hypothetical protein